VSVAEYTTLLVEQYNQGKFELISAELEYEAYEFTLYTNLIFIESYNYKEQVLEAFERKLWEYHAIK